MNRVLLAAVLLASASCARMTQRAAPVPDSVPVIPVYEISAPSDTAPLVRAPQRDPLAAATRPITLAASNADARTLLLWLAGESGVSMVISPDVTARVSVSFENVPASHAIRAIMAEAGLSFLVAEPGTPWPPVVFYQLPVNIDRASAETISARFGVSLDMARWIVESRNRP